MREIWFRGKRLDNGQWIEGWLIRRTYPAIETTLCYIVTKGRSLVIDTVYPVARSTAGQYTGLRDKNGKMIFEGDIVRAVDALSRPQDTGHTFVGVVGYQDCSFVIVSDFFTHYRWIDYAVEVIGNIHDNPELLEE